jgi:hypothetical protein
MRPVLAQADFVDLHVGRGRVLKNKKMVRNARDADVL